MGIIVHGSLLAIAILLLSSGVYALPAVIITGLLVALVRRPGRAADKSCGRKRIA